MAELYQGKFSGEEIDSRLDNAKRTCRFVIGTSTAGWTTDDCDYLCDGTADDVEINAAIQALPATGGQILILDGTYKITAPITVNKSGATLRGNGTTTILQRNWVSSVDEGVITITAENGGVTVQDIQIDGNVENYGGSRNCGIYIASGGNNIINNICNNNSDDGIHLYTSGNSTITGNTCNNNGNTGISVHTSGNNTITENTCNNNVQGGISLHASDNSIIAGNVCNNSNTGIALSASDSSTITGNICNNNDYAGINLSRFESSTITGNTCNNSNTGIRLYSSYNNTITGNTCIRGTGQPSDYTSSQYTIYITNAASSKNLIVGNNIMGKNYVDKGTDNTWANNKFE